MNIYEYQRQVGEWSRHNFPENKPLDPFLGIVEEVGELSHAILKGKQGIRKFQDPRDQIMDALGDIFIFMCDYAERSGLDLEACIFTTWEIVKKRDWIKYPQNGVTE